MVWNRLGVWLFWLAWPGIFLFLRWSHRTRIAIVAGNEILVVKGWLGSGHWGLPGGGLHLGEDPLGGAVRELKEEAGITVQSNQLKPLAVKPHAHEHGIRYHLYAFVVRLDHKPPLAKQKFEITEVQWLPIADLSRYPKLAQTTKDILAAL